MSDDTTLALACVTALRQTWEAHPPAVPPDGDRLWVRWTDTGPADPGWDDWRLVGLVHPGGRVEWLSEGDATSPLAVEIEAAAGGGRRSGRVAAGPLVLDWGLFRGDGPAGQRVSDWCPPGAA